MTDTIRVTIEPTATHIDYENGHTWSGHDVTICQESHDGSNRGVDVMSWHTDCDDMRAVKVDITRKFFGAGVLPVLRQTRKPYSIQDWTDGRRSYDLPVGRMNVYGDGIIPVLASLLSGVTFI